ncbi:hypothetical protein LguiA_021099 [Lonicera macranthoides]
MRNGSSEVSQKIPSRVVSSEVPQKTYARALSSETSQKISPRAVSSEAPQKISPRVARQLKTTGLESDSSSSSNQARTPKNISPKVADHRSPRSPVSEKKRPSRVSELESQVSQLQDDLKKVKDQLISSEARKKELILQSASEESHKTELHGLSQERDQEWKSELETMKNQQLVDSAALAAAKNEIQQLNAQLEMVAESEATQTKQALSANSELQSLKESLAETLSHMEEMKNQLRDCKESESQAKALVGETLLQLETARQTVEILRLDDVKTKEAYDAMAIELDQSKVRVNLLEGLVTKLKADACNDEKIELETNKNEKIGDSTEIELKSEVGYLRSALEMAETRYHEEQIRSTVQITGVYELLEDIKSKSSLREAELEDELKKAKACIEELKANLMDKETELQGICEENEDLNSRLGSTSSGQRELELEKELRKTREDIKNLKANMMDKETELQNISEENEILKHEVVKKEVKEVNGGKMNDDVIAQLEVLRAAEREALVKLGCVMEEADKSNRRATRVTEQLEAAQAVNSDMEAELRRLKVQSDQWRKAAEAAAAMLSTGNNGKFVDRTCSLDSNYNPATCKISSPFSEEMDDDFLKKKNGNVLKRIGVLWKKPQK